MTHDPDAHLQQIQQALLADVGAKYRRGQAEHGGHLAQKPGMIRSLHEEILDAAVYFYTLRTQLDAVLFLLQTSAAAADWDGVNRAAAQLRAILFGQEQS